MQEQGREKTPGIDRHVKERGRVCTRPVCTVRQFGLRLNRATIGAAAVCTTMPEMGDLTLWLPKSRIIVGVRLKFVRDVAAFIHLPGTLNRLGRRSFRIVVSAGNCVNPSVRLGPRFGFCLLSDFRNGCWRGLHEV